MYYYHGIQISVSNENHIHWPNPHKLKTSKLRIIKIGGSQDKKICNQVLAEEISQRQASEFLMRKGGWRVGGGEDSILYMCAAYLKANDEVKEKQ